MRNKEWTTLEKTTANERREVTNEPQTYKYTFIMDFRGGTYISQLPSRNVKSAVIDWIEQINISNIKHFGEKSKVELYKELVNNDNDPTAIETVQNIWIVCALIKNGFVKIHIIKTC